jgi:hypothetical protein
MIAARAAASAAVCADILTKCMYRMSVTRPSIPHMGTIANVTINRTWPLRRLRLLDSIPKILLKLKRSAEKRVLSSSFPATTTLVGIQGRFNTSVC